MKRVTIEVVVKASIMIDESELPKGKRSDSLVAKRAILWFGEQLAEHIDDDTGGTDTATVIRSKVVSVKRVKEL